MSVAWMFDSYEVIFHLFHAHRHQFSPNRFAVIKNIPPTPLALRDVETSKEQGIYEI